ncbi:MAG: hypothetical protein JZU53_12225 [Paludibacter sp.]|nr:hypothetical protein [Paludibacter sp.]
MKLTSIITRIVSTLGIDKAILFTSSNSLIGGVGNVISIILVVKCLSGFEQGFYYTFGSIVAIQVFFELGLNGIITQYVAHEASNLKWESRNILLGDSKFKSRLSSLLHFSVKWYMFFATILLLILIIVGFVFFNKYDSTNGIVSWEAPWILLAIGTSISLIISPIVAFIQGLGKVKEIAQIQLILQIFKLSIVWGGLILGASLYVLGISSILGALLLMVIIISKYRILLISIWRTQIIEKVSYRTEIFPYQWKIALSWISGYFIFQLFNPVLFATEGAEVAGQMGMTLAALNGIQSLSFAWMTTKIPLFSGLIAQRKFNVLDTVFNKTLKQSSIINFCGLFFLIVLIYLIRNFEIKIAGKFLGNRFLNYLPMILMMIPIFLNQFISSWATYLRCHKKEPFLVISIVSGVLCALSTLLLGKYFGVIGITTGYCLITLMTLFWAYYIYKNKKVEWH